MSNREEGFTLVESLIAIAILAGTVSTILFVVGSNADRSATSLDRFRTVFSADAILSRVGLDIPLVPQRLSGRLADGSFWSVDISRYVEPDFPAELESRLLAVEVAVTPKRVRGDGVKLRTLKRIGY